jgi:hypothetical protein
MAGPMTDRPVADRGPLGDSEPGSLREALLWHHNHYEDGTPTYPTYRNRCPVGCDDLSPVGTKDGHPIPTGPSAFEFRRVCTSSTATCRCRSALAGAGSLLDIINDLMERMDWVGTGGQKSGDIERREFEVRIARATGGHVR